MSESLQENRVPELCLNNNQMECVIAAILTVGSLAGQGASADKAVSLYAETLKHLRIKGYFNPATPHYQSSERR